MENYSGYDKFRNCFVCSPTNPIGLHMTNSYVGERSHMEIVPNENMCGLNGIMHGGFSLMIMDEIMYYAVDYFGVDSVTLHTDCDFKSPAVIGHKLIAEGWVTKRDGKKFYAAGELRDAETGMVVVTATGLYYEMDLSKFLPDEE